MIKLLRTIVLPAFLLIAVVDSQAQMRLTEFMYDGTGNMEFMEFTNVGTTTVDMTGWSFDDDSRAAGTVSLSGFGVVQPGESVIFTQTTAAAFRTAWGLCNGVKIIGGNATNLGREDEINLYNASNVLVDRLTFGDQTYSLGSIRTTNVSGVPNNATVLGANTIAAWKYSVVGDADGAISRGGIIASPGTTSLRTVTYDPCTVNATAPTIVINTTATNNYLDGGISASPVSPYAVSGVINDPTDPASVYGIDFTIGDDATPVGNLVVTATSNNLTVVPAANLTLTGTGANRNLKISPAAVGYANITVTVNDGTNNTSYIISYAASQATAATINWPTGISDASAALALDNDYMVIANDESNLLYVYSRHNSGLPVKTADFNNANVLSLTDGSTGSWKEVDVEAAVKSTTVTGRTYWMGSMSNNSSAETKPNRDRVFAIDIAGTGAATTFSNAGYVSGLRARLITWGDGHGYNFTAAAANGKDPKAIDGFNIEGMVFGPDNSTMYIGFRAPLVPNVNRTKAVIAPIANFETWFNNGAPVGNPTIGAPIELDLGGRGIRDIIRLPNNFYVIVAGSYGSTAVPAIYLWSGNATDAPFIVSSFNLGTQNAEAVLPVFNGGQLALDRLQIISDIGDDALYADGTAAKDLSLDNFKKFSSAVVVSSTSGALPVSFVYFNADKQGQAVRLSWKNEDAASVARFEVLRSFNGRDFTAIGSVAASDNQTLYSFTDNTLTGNNKVYYRIRAIEHSGTNTLTAVRFVDYSEVASLITLYPNPVVNNRFSIVVNTAGTKTLTVFGSNGTAYRQLQFNNQVMDMSTIGWPAGWYLVNVKTADGFTATYKLIVP